MKPTPEKLRLPVYVLMGLMSCLPILGYSQQNQSYKPVSQLVDDFAHGYRGEPEYVPKGGNHTKPVDLDMAVPVDQTAGGCSVQVSSNSSQSHTFTTQSNDVCKVRLAIFSHPYWHASDETNKPVVLDKSPERLIIAVVPPGIHTIQIHFRAESRSRLVSKIVSGVVAFILLLIFVKLGYLLDSGNHNL